MKVFFDELFIVGVDEHEYYYINEGKGYAQMFLWLQVLDEEQHKQANQNEYNLITQMPSTSSF